MAGWRRALLGLVLPLPLCAMSAAAADGTRARPLVAVVALNDGTEITDFLVPFATLAGAGVADVVAVAGEAGPVQMLPAVRLALDTTLDSFDRDHPRGADWVVVPAVHHSDDPRLRAWLQHQAALGATVVGICDGVWVLAGAGLLEGHTATGHWYSLPSLRRTFPGVHWVDDRRYVHDGPVMTTTGVTASLPASVALVAMLGGDDAGRRAASSLGVSGADATHNGSAFRLRPGHVWTAAANELLLWRYEVVGVPVHDGVDEVALALTADPLGRTYRTTVVTLAPTTGSVRTRHGLTILADAAAGSRPVTRVQTPDVEPPAAALDNTLGAIDEAYGAPTGEFVRLQLEYPGSR
jgi:putative intracellular protease/amidase